MHPHLLLNFDNEWGNLLLKKKVAFSLYLAHRIPIGRYGCHQCLAKVVFENDDLPFINILNSVLMCYQNMCGRFPSNSKLRFFNIQGIPLR